MHNKPSSEKDSFIELPLDRGIASGIFVLDTKHYKGSTRVKYKGGFLSKRSAELWIGNRNQSKLVTGVQNQVNLVQRIVATGTVVIPVICVLAFYRGNWEAFSFLHQEKVNGIFLNNRGIAPLVSKKGSFRAGEMSQVVRLLAGSMPAPVCVLRAD